MTSLAVMQPTYMPWMGYFDLMDQVDHFLFLDDVQLARQSWQTRNRIRGPSGQELMLSLPIQHSGDLDQTLWETRLAESKPWRKKHSRTVDQAYARAPHGRATSAHWQAMLAQPSESLAALTEQTITQTANRLGILTPIGRACDYPGPKDRVDRLIELCRSVGATTYLSPPGAAEYLQTDEALDRFDTAKIMLRFQQYHHPVYDQGGIEFLSHLGIVDALAHLGFDACLAIIRSGRHEPVDLTALTQA